VEAAFLAGAKADALKKLAATARQVADAGQKRPWLEALAKTIAGKEQYEVQAKRKTQTLRDPCADVIAQLQQEPA
jgi:hypothetical protein